MIQIVRIRERRRRREGKSTVFKYNQLKVDEQKIERFIREKLGRDQIDRMNIDDGLCLPLQTSLSRDQLNFTNDMHQCRRPPVLLTGHLML